MQQRHSLTNSISINDQDRIKQHTLKVKTMPFPINISFKKFTPIKEKNFLHKKLSILDQSTVNHRLQAQRVEAKKYQQKQNKFMDTICHELRNPANGIQGSLDILKSRMNAGDESAGQQQKNINNLINSIQVCVNHQILIIDDFLSLKKLKNHEVTLENTIFDPKESILAAIKMFEPSCLSQDTRFIHAFPEASTVSKGDPNAFKQVLVNLISNAVKLTSTGEINVSLKELKKVDGYHYFEIVLTDPHKVILEEASAEMFKNSAKASRKSPHPYGDSSLGLSISKKLAHLMGGDIKMHTEKERGTLFRFTLKCACLSHEEKTQVSMTVATKPTEVILPLPLGIKKILIVEDNIINQKVLQFALKSQNYRCAIAQDGKEALAFFNVDTFDVIFMDIQMPNLDGYEATKQIRKKEQELNLSPTPIICLSSNVREECKEKALRVGMNDFIAKPFRKEEILKKIEQLTRINPEIASLKPKEENPLKAIKKEGEPSKEPFSSVKGLTTFFHQEFNHKAYAKYLIKKCLPSEITVKKEERQLAIETLIKVFEETKIQDCLPQATEKLIKNVLKGSFEKTWGSFFCCGTHHGIRMTSYKGKIAFTEESLTPILASVPGELKGEINNMPGYREFVR